MVSVLGTRICASRPGLAMPRPVGRLSASGQRVHPKKVLSSSSARCALCEPLQWQWVISLSNSLLAPRSSSTELRFQYFEDSQDPKGTTRENKYSSMGR